MEYHRNTDACSRLDEAFLRMPISHRHKTIFIHVPKTGGTSIEAVLGMHGDRHDVGIVPYANQSADRTHLYGRRLQHLTAEGLRAELNDESVFASYFKFAIVRNPWDRLVSTCAWSGQRWAQGRMLERDEFSAFVRKVHAESRGAAGTAGAERPHPHPVPLVHLLPQARFILDASGRDVVEFVGRFETLAEDWQVIRARLQIEADLPVRMKSVHRPYREYYDAETRDMAAETYAEDIARFGYEF